MLADELEAAAKEEAMKPAKLSVHHKVSTMQC